MSTLGKCQNVENQFLYTRGLQSKSSVYVLSYCFTLSLMCGRFHIHILCLLVLFQVKLHNMDVETYKGSV